MLSQPFSCRDLHTLDELKRVVELEAIVWEYTDLQDVVPVPILAINVKRGGILIGAFDESEAMVGFAYSLPGLKSGHLIQWSHMVGVLEAHRNTGLGRLLKLEQRKRALEMGIKVIEWTFDPMQSMNAHFNLTKLGAVIIEYAENIYGEEFKKFFAAYPVKVRRINGREDNLREGKKEIKQLYLNIIQRNKISPQRLQKILEVYIQEKKRTGSAAYLKTLRNWLKQDIWKDVIEWVANKQSTNNNKDIDYGGKLI